MGTGASGLFSEMLRSFGQDITNDNMADVEILYYRKGEWWKQQHRYSVVSPTHRVIPPVSVAARLHDLYASAIGRSVVIGQCDRDLVFL